MATDEDIPAVSDTENAKKSDGTSTAGEYNMDEVNDTESDEQSASGDEVKTENNKRDIDEVEKKDEKTDDSKEQDTDVSPTTIKNEKN